MLALSWLHAAAAVVLVVLTGYAALIDYRSLILPDKVNAALFAAGLLFGHLLGTVDIVSAVLASLLGAGLLLGVSTAFRWRRGYDGLGLGDVKFLGAAGPWIDVSGIPVVMLIACATALSGIAVRLAFDRTFDRTQPIAFGPALAIGIIIVGLCRAVFGVEWTSLLEPG